MSKYRTPHNLMRSVLDDTEYKNFCVAWDRNNYPEVRGQCFNAARNNDSTRVLINAFYWSETGQGDGYWRNISVSINEIKENLRER